MAASFSSVESSSFGGSSRQPLRYAASSGVSDGSGSAYEWSGSAEGARSLGDGWSAGSDDTTTSSMYISPVLPKPLAQSKRRRTDFALSGTFTLTWTFTQSVAPREPVPLCRSIVLPSSPVA